MYTNILNETLLPFIVKIFTVSHRLMAINDIKHTSNRTRQFLEEHRVNWWRTPVGVPDLNPIKNLWHELNEYLKREVKPKNKEELVRRINQFWKTVTPLVCAKYIGSLRKVISKVIEVGG